MVVKAKFTEYKVIIMEGDEIKEIEVTMNENRKGEKPVFDHVKKIYPDVRPLVVKSKEVHEKTYEVNRDEFNAIAKEIAKEN